MKKNANEKKEQYNYLLYVPVIKHTDFSTNEGLVTLFFKHDKPIEKFASWLVRKSKESDLTLDKAGSAAWLLMDGKRNIYEIAVEMSKISGDEEKVAIERLITFSTYLSRKGWIHFKEVKSLSPKEEPQKELN
jgi:Coenzyme PQQ synthesis protein D (PqqD)